MTAAQQSRHRVWQRMPQGWIEFRALGDRSPQEWIDRYLESGEGWLPDEARASITEGFHAGVRMFSDVPFDFAGVSIVLGERPAVSFLCTNVVATTADEVADSAALHRLLPLGRFGDDSTAETFTSPDDRVGTVSSGLVSRGGVDAVMTVGEIRLPDDAGTVLIMGMCSDPAQRHELTVLTAFALSMTQYLPDGVEPQLPEGARFEAPLDGE
ncbi:hypothetical protein [Microbacterium sp. Se5.02b]|uniref:hypothetical protein n=1 Tax=Microbacterium sp. Se5.02b TaxID=2864103 RepID=UPI001C68A068|nr:hypothetical protein [Microbacterium sp. Se5.02b]QYM64887.1 hypothetical protein K1X59_03150 [Microbacterium sp. Se5.02b]